MRILFVHEVNYRAKVVYEIHDFPELLSLRGHDVVFLDYPEGESRSGLSAILDVRTRVRTGVCRAHDGASIEVRTAGRGLFPPIDRVTASLTHVPLIARALKSKSFDAVVLYSVPTNGWQTIALARRYGIPVLFRAIDVSHLLRPTIFRRLIRRAERFIYKHADGVSVNNTALREYAIASGAIRPNVSVEYPGIDLDRFHPGPKSPELLRRYGLDVADRVIVFMGTLFRFSGLDWLIRQLAPILLKRPDLKLLLLGGGEAESELKELVRELRLQRSVVFTGFIEYDDLVSHLHLGDVAVNPFKEELVTRNALPGKVLQYAASGLPTVCTRLDGMQGLLPEGDGITYAAPGEPFVSTVLRLVDDDDARRKLAERARTAMEARCQWTERAAAFEQVVQALVDRVTEKRS